MHGGLPVLGNGRVEAERLGEDGLQQDCVILAAAGELAVAGELLVETSTREVKGLRDLWIGKSAESWLHGLHELEVAENSLSGSSTVERRGKAN